MSYHLSLPILPSHLTTQLSFPNSCPLKGWNAHFSLLLFFLILKKSTEAQNRGENGARLRLVLRALRLTRPPGCERCQGPLCQLEQALLFPWLPAQSWLLAFILLRGTHPKGSILLFSCQPSQSPKVIRSYQNDLAT